MQDNQKQLSDVEHNSVLQYGKKLASNCLLAGILLIVLFFFQSVSTSDTSPTGNLTYSDSGLFKLYHIVPTDKCLQVSTNGTIAHKELKESKYKEIELTHTVKFVCRPSFDWKKERAIMKENISPSKKEEK